MTSGRLNSQLAHRVLDHIEAHPEQYSPDTEISVVDADGFITDSADGRLIASFTGWTCLLSGDRLALSDHQHDGVGIVSAVGESHDAHYRAANLLGLEVDDDDWVLGMEAGLTVAALRNSVIEIFGLRPDGVVAP